MKVAVAIDSFKGSLSSYQAAKAIEEGVYAVNPDAEVVIQAVADGGEGTVDALIEGMNGKKINVCVHDPLFREHETYYGVIDQSAVMEMASASGLPLLTLEERNPLLTTTFGVGEMIMDAIERGYRHFIVGIGGSGTNDGGTGMLMAMGYRFLDEEAQPIRLGAQDLDKIAEIDDRLVDSRIKECRFEIACDVSNPLCGENGASAVYGPQKGADAFMIQKMDAGLAHFAAVTKAYNKTDYQEVSGTGAAGGLGFAFLSYLHSKLVSGIDLVLTFVQLEDKLKDADYVFTGEGRMDGQTLMNKTPIGVARLAKKHGCKVIALAGQINEEAYLLNDHGIDAMFSVVPGVVELEYAMKQENAYRHLKNTVIQILRLENMK
ncbi:MAG: glycerate kinase [Beduini sp.]|uniref:glycerate kinase n=1 Tax=Beduini sp. TaxID=1922300 RepID=UPI0011CCAFD1